MKQFLTLIILVGLTLLWQSSLRGHHAFSSEFDIDRPIELRGVITRMEWVNPHTWLHMTATSEDEATEEWMLEGGTPNTLLPVSYTHLTLPTIYSV